MKTEEQIKNMIEFKKITVKEAKTHNGSFFIEQADEAEIEIEILEWVLED